MTWRPASLLEAPEIDFPARRPGRTRCPTCGVFRPRAVIVDVRPLPIPEDWACDCCWSRWQRELRPVDGLGPIVTVGDTWLDQRAWKLRWVTALEAPPDIIQKFQPPPDV